MFRPDPKPEKKKKGKKLTGEGAMFMQIFYDRPHVSFIDGKWLGDEPLVQFFAHVLPKSTYPKFRLNPKNIVLLTFEQHRWWDQGSRSVLRQLPEWEKMFRLEEELRYEYSLI